MATYYMTSKSSSTVGYWEECKAATLVGAKREATRNYGGGYNGSVLMVAVGDNVNEQRQVLASRSVTGARWDVGTPCHRSIDRAFDVGDKLFVDGRSDGE